MENQEKMQNLIDELKKIFGTDSFDEVGEKVARVIEISKEINITAPKAIDELKSHA